MKKLFILLFACVSVLGRAQNPDFLPQVYSPNAAELGKYGKIPVSYFNGLPNISIPLTELKAKDYTLPIYLTYHASGNKPDQHPGWVGLGWTLHAGGCINRIVNGQKDELTNYEAKDLLLPYGMFQELIDPRLEDPFQYAYDQTLNHIGNLYHAQMTQETDWENRSNLHNVSTKNYRKDYAPDEFQVCLDGINASFYITGENEIQIVSQSDADFKVEWSLRDMYGREEYELFPARFAGGYNVPIKSRLYAYISEIVLTNHDGVKYIFGRDENAIEFSTNYYCLDKNSAAIFSSTPNTWLLSSIETPNGEVITFHYEKEKGVNLIKHDIHTLWKYTQDTESVDPVVPGVEIIWHYGNDSDELIDGGVRSSISFTMLRPSYLASISCKMSSDSVSFSRTRTVEAAYDYTSKELEKRNIDFCTRRGIPFETLREADQYYQLSGINHKGEKISFGYTQSDSTRLHLLSLDFSDETNTNQGGRYSFQYNDKWAFPGYNSKRTDKWNYFNDIYYGSTPFVSMESVRQPDSEKMKLEILTRLDYPTGGYSLFEYEPHSYSKVMRQFPFELRSVDSPHDSIAGGLRIKTITDVDNTGTSETRVFTYDGTDGMSSGVLSGYPQYHANGFRFYDFIIFTVYLGDIKMSNGGIYQLGSELPLASLSQTHGNHVTYSQVTETVSGSGRTVFQYSNHEDELSRDTSPLMFQNFNNLLLVSPFNTRQLFRGQLLSKTSYDKAGRKVSEEENTYHIDTLTAIKSVEMTDACGGFLRRTSYVKIYSCYPYLEHSRICFYPDNGGVPLLETTDYEYDSHRQLVKTIRRRGTHQEETRTLYSGDASLANRSPYSGMQAAGIFDRPVEQTVLRDGKVVSSSLITYRQLGDDMFVPGKYFEARLNSPIPSSSWHPYNGSFSSEQESIYGAARLSFDSYDSHANILAATAEGGLHSLYTWDPSGMNPEASFTGMLTPVRNVIVEDNAYQSMDFHRKHLTEYTFEFDAERSGEFSFCMAWPDCIAYDMAGTLDGNPVFNYEAPKQKGTRKDPVTMPPVDGPIMTPLTELYRGAISTGHHVFKVYPTGEPQHGSDWAQLDVMLDGEGSISYPVYRTEQRSDELGAWYFDFEKDGNHDIGFHSGMSWKGLKTFSKSIPSGIPYTIDWMECGSNGQWTYKTREFTGRATIGGSAVSIDNVRIYPSDAAVNSWTWTNANDLSSVTDGRGITEQYEYDGLGRLVTVRDSEGNKKASYAYHYASTGSETPDNYVKTSLYTNEGGITARETIQYHDGLGRPWQTLSLNAGKDEDNNVRHLAEQTDYDAAGRPFRTWLPFRTASLLPQSSTPSESLYSDSEPFSLVEYDGSPLDRPRLEYGPGANWHSNGKAVSHGYYTNGTSTTLNCKRFTLAWSGDTTVVVSNNGNIPSATLSVESLTDEDGLTLLTFKNMYGQTLLERRHPQFGIDFDTYYIYDNLGRLSAVLPPAIANKSVISSTDIDKYAYLYRYDSRGNCIAKKLPGCGWSFMVYDARGAMIMSQDAVQRNNGKWTLLLTDGQGRQCLTGVCAASLDAFSNPYGKATIYVRKTGNPGDVHVSRDRNYYGYTLYTMTPRNLTVNQATLWSPYGPAESYDRVLGPTTSAQVLKTTYTYDAKGRVMKTERQTHLGGTETEQVTYSFTDEVLSRALVHTNAAGQSQLEQYTYTYDHWGRPLKTTHRYGTGNETVLHNNAYDGLGRLSSDSRNGAPALYTSYTNNVRSWLTSILCGGGSTFREALYYESPISRGTPRWAGNISQMAWKSGTDPTTHRYSFTYDNFGRLTSAAYDGGARGGNYGTSYIYDANSNLISISRAAIEGPKGAVTIMSGITNYLLDGNQVKGRIQDGGLNAYVGGSSVIDFRQVYYDACGRMVRDDDRGVSKILYNDLYLPSEIRYAATDSGQEPESYGVQYAADGRKLRTGRIVSAMKQFNNVNVFEDIQELGKQESSRADTLHFINPGSQISIGLEPTLEPVVRYESPTDYVGNLVYKDGVLEKILVDGGYITAADMNYHFFVTDHLGNVRVVVNSAGTVEQVNQYYPYGESAEMGMPVQPTTDNPYKWSGKEWDEQQAAYDFGARMYSASDARWTTMDPMSEKYYHISPYAYCAGNPVNLVDPDGREWDVANGVITVYLNYTNSTNLSDEEIRKYQQAINTLFNSVISTASSGQYSGNVVFYNDNHDIVQLMDFGTFGDNSFGGGTTYMSSFINVNDKDGKLGSPDSIAQTAVHELFHTVRLAHPFESTQTSDTELVQQGPNCFLTTENTDPDIANNIMSYNSIRINGQTGTDLVKLTPGQLRYVEKEIQLQKQGFGFIGRGKDYEYENYWHNWPGVPVKRVH